MPPLRAIVACLLALTLGALVAATPSRAQSMQVALVVEVVDGDTIRVDLGGGDVQTIRYLDVDAPALSDACGPQARARNAALVMDRAVGLVAGAAEADADGALPRYVYVEGLLVNATLVREGYAVAVTPPPDDAHARELADLQAQAQAAKAGLWGLCGGPAAPQQESGVAATPAPSASLASSPSGPPASPADYLPAPAELPAGFVHAPERDQAQDGPEGAWLARWYTRPGSQGSPDSGGLIVAADVASGLSQAGHTYAATVDAWRGNGWTFSGLRDVGEEAVVGHRTTDPNPQRPTEGVVVAFRVGRITALVSWLDQGDPNGLDHAMQLARVIEAKARANPSPAAASADTPPGA